MLFPVGHNLPDLSQNDFRLLLFEPEKRSHFKGQIEVQRVVGFGDIEAQSRVIA